MSSTKTPDRPKSPHWLLMASIALATPLGAGAEPDRGVRGVAEQQLAALPNGDAALAYHLALRLEAQGYADLAKRALERVVAADPSHVAARRALGFERVGARWLSGDELRRAKGFVRVSGTWVLAEEASAADFNLPRLRTAPRALRGGRSASRIRAAQELARMGDRRGIPILVAAWARSESGAVGGYFAATRQMSYVQDFDVEVA